MFAIIITPSLALCLVLAIALTAAAVVAYLDHRLSSLEKRRADVDQLLETLSTLAAGAVRVFGPRRPPMFSKVKPGERVWKAVKVISAVASPQDKSRQQKHSR